MDCNSHIYFGSDDSNVYALYDRGTTAAQKWRFSAGSAVFTKPAVKADGTVYVGASDNRLYAINQFANPKNRKSLRITNTPDNWFSAGRWAVRMEVTRSLTPSGGTYPYNLRTWVRQCNSLGLHQCDWQLLC